MLLLLVQDILQTLSGKSYHQHRPGTLQNDIDQQFLRYRPLQTSQHIFQIMRQDDQRQGCHHNCQKIYCTYRYTIGKIKQILLVHDIDHAHRHTNAAQHIIRKDASRNQAEQISHQNKQGSQQQRL